MDAESTKRVADALGLWFVHHHATFYLSADKDFDNAWVRICSTHLTTIGDVGAGAPRDQLRAIAELGYS